MDTNKSKGFIRFAAAIIAAAGILGGGALGFAAGANASTTMPQQKTQEQVAEAHTYQPGSQSGQHPTRVRPAQPPKRPSTGEPPAQGRPVRPAR